MLRDTVYGLTCKTSDVLLLHILQQAILKGQGSSQVELNLVTGEFDAVFFAGRRHLGTARTKMTRSVIQPKPDAKISFDLQLVHAVVAVNVADNKQVLAWR